MSAARAAESPPEQLAALERLERLPRAVLVRGEEPWFRDRAIEQLRARGLKAGLELCAHDGRDPDFDAAAVVGDLTSASLFGSARLVVVRGADGPLAARGAEPTPLTRAIEAFCGSAELEGTLVLEAEHLRRDHRAAKAVLAAGGPLLDCRKLWDSPAPWDRNPDPARTELARFAQGRARELGLRLDPRQAAHMAQRLGNDLYAIGAELGKLLHLGPRALPEIGLRAGGAPWTAAAALAREDAARGLAAVEALYRAGFHGKDGKRELDPDALTAMLLGALSREVRQGLAVSRALSGTGDEAAAVEAGGYKGPPGGRAALIAAARRRSPARWRAMLLDVIDCERRMKSGSPVGAADFALLVLRWRA